MINLKFLVRIFIAFSILTLAASCGVKDGNAVTSTSNGPLTQVSADCGNSSCM